MGDAVITLQELCQEMDVFLDIKAFNDYCDNGIQVQGKQEIFHIATAVTASLQTIKEAVSLGVQALIVHHGLFWHGDPYPVIGAKKEKLQELLAHDISLLAYHLPLDGNREVGNNWKAARDLGWSDLEPFGEFKGAYIGVKGKFPRIKRAEFQRRLEDYYEHPAFAAYGGKEDVESAALVSGGAYKLLPAAAKAKVDNFITGNFDEPAWHNANEEKINFFAMGHSATERIGPRALGEHAGRVFNLKHTFIDLPNPF